MKSFIATGTTQWPDNGPNMIHNRLKAESMDHARIKVQNTMDMSRDWVIEECK